MTLKPVPNTVIAEFVDDIFSVIGSPETGARKKK